MTSTRRLAGALCLAFCSSLSNAQDYTTDNLISDPWFGATVNSTVTPGDGSHTQSSGPTPIYNPQTNTITWSYNQQSVMNVIAINAALSAAGTGIRISGYNYSWEYYNQGFNSGNLSAFTQLISSSGSLLEQRSYTMPGTTDGWTLYSGTETYNNQYDISSLGSFRLYFSGKDDRWWAGYYGPMVRNPSISFNYTVGEPDPCDSPYSILCLQNFISFSDPEPIIETPSVVANDPAREINEGSLSLHQSDDQQTQSTGSGIARSTILNIVAREQLRIGNLERSTVETSIEISIDQATQSVEQAESVAIIQSLSSNTVSLEALGGQSQEETRSVSTVNSGFSAVDVTNQSSTFTGDEQNENTTDKVRQNVSDSELAGGVTLASLGSTPQGFQAYSITMPDNSFYSPREIYRNQKVVDSPAARGLLGRSDRIHQDMIDSQYR